MQLALLAAFLVCGSSEPIAYSGDGAGEFADSAVNELVPGAAAIDASVTGASALDASGVDLSEAGEIETYAADQSIVAQVDTTSTPLLNGGGVVAAGRRSSFFVLPGAGQVFAMGENKHGQLGVDSTDDVFIPTPVLLDNPSYPESVWVVAIAASAVHTLFLTQEGEVYATGWNRFGQFGTGGSEKVRIPTKVHSGVSSIATGYGHSLFLMEDQTVQACGLNSAGQLGDGTKTNRGTPVTAFDQFPAVQIAAGYDFSYFLTEDMQVFAVGQNLAGQLGDTTKNTRLSPVLTTIFRVEEIAAGWAHGIFRRGDFVWATGANSAGQFGCEPNVKTFSRPFRILDLSYSSRSWAGGEGTCTWWETGDLNMTLKCSGSNLDGQLGLGDLGIVRNMMTVPVVKPNQVALGPSHSLFMMRNYADIKMSGTNANGELGDGTSISSNQFKELGLDLSATTTITKTVTTITITGTVTTFTATTVFREPSSELDGLLDDEDMVIMLRILLSLGVVALLAGIVVRRSSGVEDAELGRRPQAELATRVTRPAGWPAEF